MSDRFSSAHVAAWRRDGCVVIPDFFTTDEVVAVANDFEACQLWAKSLTPYREALS